MKTARIIFHIDLNAFFASCEVAENEALKNKPIVIAHNDNYDRGLIVSPSYEARKYGIKTTMRVGEAKQICPHVIVVEPNGELYSSYSKKFYDYLKTITNLVQMASIDEAYLDITSFNLGSDCLKLAQKIQNDLLSLYKLPCSIGIGPNKLLAKMGSDFKKPLGISVIRKRDVPNLIWPLPISDMLFIGKKTAPKLIELGIKTIGDLANYSNVEYLKEKIGANFVETMISRCHGNDDDPVIIEEFLAKSVSAAHTFMDEVIDYDLLVQTIKILINSISYKLQSDKLLSCNLGVYLKYTDNQYFNKSTPLKQITNDENELLKQAKNLFDSYYIYSQGVRQISIYSNRLKIQKDDDKQLSIFDDFEKISKSSNVDNLIENINMQLGKSIITKGMKK